MTDAAVPLVLLASASPRRTQLLAQLGVNHRVQAVNVDETPFPDELPAIHVQRLARTKASAGWAAQPCSGARLPVLGADTVVVCDGRIFGKPRDRESRLLMLATLGNRVHEVLTGVALASASGLREALSVSRVHLRAIAPAEAERYWASGEPCDKAGSYAIQGLGAIFVQRLEGSYSGVMGLPLFETAQLLEEAGLAPLPA